MARIYFIAGCNRSRIRGERRTFRPSFCKSTTSGSDIGESSCLLSEGIMGLYGIVRLFAMIGSFNFNCCAAGFIKDGFVQQVPFEFTEEVSTLKRRFGFPFRCLCLHC